MHNRDRLGSTDDDAWNGRVPLRSTDDCGWLRDAHIVSAFTNICADDVRQVSARRASSKCRECGWRDRRKPRETCRFLQPCVSEFPIFHRSEDRALHPTS